MSGRYLATEYEIQQFNQSQTAKIISIKQKRLEKENARKKAICQFRNTLYSVTIVLVFALIFGSIIYQNSLVNEAKYDIFNLKSEIKSLEAQIEEMNAKLESHTELKNIETKAMNQLNMQYPTKEQIVYLDSSHEYVLDAPDPVEPEIITQNSETKWNDLIAALLNSN
jgi:DNA gyrase/topoisomerase IV subunit A